MWDGILNFTSKYSTIINLSTLIATLIAGTVFLLRQYFTLYFFQKWLQKQRNDLDKNAEEYKYQLQRQMLKFELKTTWLNSVYPELFCKFKIAEASICNLCGKKQTNKQVTLDEIERAELQRMEAVSFMVSKLLFISKEVEKGSDDLMILMGKFKTILNSNSEKEIQLYKQQIRDLTDKFQEQMKKELGADR